MKPIEIVHRQIENWNAENFDAIYETFDPNIVVRTDRSWPEPVFYGAEDAQQLWRSVRENMGLGEMEIEEEYDLGDRVFIRVNNPVHSPSGVESDYKWSMLLTARGGKAILIEFFIDDAEIRAELGL